MPKTQIRTYACGTKLRRAARLRRSANRGIADYAVGEMWFTSPEEAKRHIRAGRVTGAARSSALPDLLTINEFVRGNEGSGWQSLWVHFRWLRSHRASGGFLPRMHSGRHGDDRKIAHRDRRQNRGGMVARLVRPVADRGSPKRCVT